MSKSLDLQLNLNNILKSSAGEGGKSGEFFFSSFDNRLMLKSLPEEELGVLENTLEKYF